MSLPNTVFGSIIRRVVISTPYQYWEAIASAIPMNVLERNFQRLGPGGILYHAGIVLPDLVV